MDRVGCANQPSPTMDTASLCQPFLYKILIGLYGETIGYKQMCSIFDGRVAQVVEQVEQKN